MEGREGGREGGRMADIMLHIHTMEPCIVLCDWVLSFS